MRKTPRWWAVAPPTPAEAPQAKRRTAARSRGSIVLILAVVVGFVVTVLLLFFRIGRQVGGGGPGAMSLAASVPVAPASPPPSAAPRPPADKEPVRATPDAGETDGSLVQPSGTPGVRSRPTREVFRKPGF